jgi:hypothetical protein
VDVLTLVGQQHVTQKILAAYRQEPTAETLVLSVIEVHSVLQTGRSVRDSAIVGKLPQDQLLHQELVLKFKWPSIIVGCVVVAGLFHMVMVVRVL